MSLPRADFNRWVADAYQHLYDLVHLRTHPLTGILIPDPSLRRKEKAWRLHHILLDVIDELDPGPQAPAFSREWRRHRLMVLRYVDGLDPQSVADQLAISRRHFYREHEAAIEAVASILWDRYVARMESPAAQPEAVSQEPADRLELLRLEAARLSQANRYSHLADVVEGAVELVREMVKQKEIHLLLDMEPNLPNVGMDRSMLRQLLLEVLSYVIGSLTGGELRIQAVHERDHVRLTICSRGGEKEQEKTQTDEEDVRISMLQELATVQNARLLPIADDVGRGGFELELPTAPPRTVLVVDDNKDVLQLFQRYLQSHHYRVVTAQSSAEAIRLARELQPYAITLDLMMPERDGWNVLQTLTNQPRTQHIPVIVCTVLSAKELALSLGATAFLEKPVTEETLISVLRVLEGR
ncbi:MAG: response regulator [Chloroflexi bacterium]|nr:response regulator [Chloroflexota bacterium]